MKLLLRAKTLGKRVTLISAAFVLAVSTLAAATPFIATEQVNAVGGQLYVSTTGSDNTDCTDAAQPCLTIQYAIGQSHEYDTINIAAGTYAESLNINRSISLVGASQATTTITAPVSLVNGKDLLTVTGAGVNATLANLTVNGVSDAYTNDSAIVHIYNGANATVRDVHVTGAHKNIVGTTYIYGILVGTRGSSAVGTAGTATITDTTITEYGRGGIYVSGNGSYATIASSTIQAASGYPGLLNGVVIEYGANANVQYNTIKGNGYVGGDWSGSGIGVWDNPDARTIIKNNTVTGNQVGLALVTDSPAVLANINVTGITGNEDNARVDSHYFDWGYWPWVTPTTVYVDSSNVADEHAIVMADGIAVVKGYNLFDNAQDAVDAVAVNGTVKLLKNLHVNTSILITKALTFDGNGLTVVSSFGAGATSQYSGVIEVQGVTNGTVRFVANNDKAFRVYGEGSKAIDGPGSYNGLHGINVYNSNVELNKVILDNNGKSGLNVGRNSNATVTNISTSNNTWYGINVDKTARGTYSTLTINGVSTHNEGSKPHIFSDSRDNVLDGSVKVNDTNLQYVRYWDGNGYKYVLDLEKPEISLSADSFNPTTFNVTASDDQGISTIGYSIWKDGTRIGVWGEGVIDWDARQNFSSTKSTYKSLAANAYVQLSSLEDGSYTIHATATDALGKSTNAQGLHFVVDRTPIVVTTDTYLRSDNVFTPTVETDEIPVSQSWAQISGPVDGVVVSDSTVLTPTFTVLQDGDYVFQLATIDAAGNESTSLFSFTYETPTPTVVSTSGGSSDNTNSAGPIFIPQSSIPQPDTEESGESEVAGAADSKGASDILAQAVDADNTDGEALGLAWYWWLLTAAGAAGIVWWIVAAIRQRGADA